MANAIAAIILKVVAPSSIIIQKFITATKKKIKEARPYDQDFEINFDIISTP